MSPSSLASIRPLCRVTSSVDLPTSSDACSPSRWDSRRWSESSQLPPYKSLLKGSEIQPRGRPPRCGFFHECSLWCHVSSLDPHIIYQDDEDRGQHRQLSNWRSPISSSPRRNLAAWWNKPNAVKPVLTFNYGVRQSLQVVMKTQSSKYFLGPMREEPPSLVSQKNYMQLYGTKYASCTLQWPIEVARTFLFTVVRGRQLYPQLRSSQYLQWRRYTGPLAAISDGSSTLYHFPSSICYLQSTSVPSFSDPHTR